MNDAYSDSFYSPSDDVAPAPVPGQGPVQNLDSRIWSPDASLSTHVDNDEYACCNSLYSFCNSLILINSRDQRSSQIHSSKQAASRRSCKTSIEIPAEAFRLIRLHDHEGFREGRGWAPAGAMDEGSWEEHSHVYYTEWMQSPAAAGPYPGSPRCTSRYTTCRCPILMNALQIIKINKMTVSEALFSTRIFATWSRRVII